MDHLQTRLDALEQQMRTVTRQLRWWRGLAGGLFVLAVLTWALPAGTAQKDPLEGGEKGLAQRVAALEDLLKHFTREDNEVFLTGANLHLVNGLGRTSCTDDADEPIPDCPNGLGNLIVGYNEPREGEENIRTGSHNVVVGQRHNFSRFGGLVVGDLNEISGDFAAVSGGRGNTASGFASAVSGGGTGIGATGGLVPNRASGPFSVVSGGFGNTASGEFSSVSGGAENTASGGAAAVSGGEHNTASVILASVSGGFRNTAAGDSSSVSGGSGNMASGPLASVSGGQFNTASDFAASVSGGQNRTAEGDFDWVAGSLFEDE